MNVAAQSAGGFAKVRSWCSVNRWILTIVGLAVLMFIFFSLLSVNAPGLYMDAVNPDYEAVKVLNPAAPVEVWEIPGDLFFQRFPLMWGLYGGSYTVYWAIPFLATMGGSLLSIRVAHLSVGIVILLLIAALSRRLTRSTTITVMAVALLAADPEYIFSFRTQAYQILFPIVFVLAYMYVLYRYPTPRGYFVAGAMAGLAAFGYFVYFFLVPGIALFALRDRLLRHRTLAIFCLGLGVLVGVTPYFVAYGSLFATLGLHGGMDWLKAALASLHVSSADSSYPARVVATVRTITALLSSDWQWQTFWNETRFDFGQSYKGFVLVSLPLLAALAVRRSDFSSRALAVIAFPTISFVICATYFGSRLGGHDLNALLPLSYVLAAVSVKQILATFIEYRWGLTRVFCAIGALVFLTNVATTATVAHKLQANTGEGLYSSVISSLPEAVAASGDKAPYVFWSWGEMMPFIYETHGSIPASAFDRLIPDLCRYGIAKVVLLGSDATAPNLEGTFPLAGLVVKHVDVGRDSSSQFPFKIVSVESASRRADCAASPASPIVPIRSSGYGSVATFKTDQPSRLSAKPSMRIVDLSAAPGVTFSSDQKLTGLAADGSLPIISVRWSVPGATATEIHMGSPAGVLFAQSGSSGSATTGPWVQSGIKFYLQDVTHGSPGKTSAILMVTSCTNCSYANSR